MPKGKKKIKDFDSEGFDSAGYTIALTSGGPPVKAAILKKLADEKRNKAINKLREGPLYK